MSEVVGCHGVGICLISCWYDRLVILRCLMAGVRLGIVRKIGLCEIVKNDRE